MPTPEAREHRVVVDRELHRLRAQFLFLFVFLLGGLILVTLLLTINANRIEYSRYDSCIARAGEIAKWNASIYPPGFVPTFPTPVCGVDPRTD